MSVWGVNPATESEKEDIRSHEKLDMCSIPVKVHRSDAREHDSRLKDNAKDTLTTSLSLQSIKFE